MSVRARLWLALLIPAVAACGARVPPAAPRQLVQSETSAPQTVTTAAPSPAPLASTPVPVPVSARERLATAAPLVRGSSHNTGQVRITLAQDCLRPGQALIAHIQAPPRAILGLFVTYADRQSHGALGVGTTDDQGRFTWTVPVAPDVPPGVAHLAVGSSGPDNRDEGGGTADAPFVVAAPGEIC